jgi:hypothetical protein
VDHYELYASSNGVTAAFLGSVPTGVYQTNLAQVGLPPGNYQIYVDAIGKPCIRDHMSPPVSAVLTTGPTVLTDLQPLWQIAWQGDPVTFSIVAGGNPPFSYQWTLNGQDIPGETNSSYCFAALTGTNFYSVAISNA